MTWIPRALGGALITLAVALAAEDKKLDPSKLPPAASKSYFERVGSPDKELREYPGAFTNLLSETFTPQVLDDLGGRCVVDPAPLGCLRVDQLGQRKIRRKLHDGIVTGSKRSPGVIQ